MHRREFLGRSLLGLGTLGLAPLSARRTWGASVVEPDSDVLELGRPYQISLAQWSLNKTLRAGKLENLDFPRFAKQRFGIRAVEYVDQFFADKSRDAGYLAELRNRCDGEGVRSWLIMVDTAGPLGASDSGLRARAVESHKAWMDAAKTLGCEVVRANARGDGNPDDLRGRMADSAAQLAEYGSGIGISFVIENHGGPSSDPDWLTRLLAEVDSPWFGALPDFGNFPGSVDKYDAVRRMMPYAKAVSAKTGRFDDAGNDLGTDYTRMMRIVLDEGYRGFVGVESGASSAEGEPEAIRKTQALLEKIRMAEPPLRPIFNGKDLTGWRKVAGGDWTVEDGVLVARNGVDWSTDPARTGSWLRTEKEHSDFELLVEYNLEPRTNSGLFFRSALERNPAFTGYEVQIYDGAGRPPSKGGPGSLYDYAAPTKNRVRPAGQWNQIRVIARGQRLRVHVNGEMVVDVKGTRASSGYIGLQNHDARSVARFRNVLLREL